MIWLEMSLYEKASNRGKIDNMVFRKITIRKKLL